MTNWMHHRFIRGAVPLVLADQQAQRQVSAWSWRQASAYFRPYGIESTLHEVRSHVWHVLFYGAA